MSGVVPGWRGRWDRIGPFRLAAAILVVFGALSLLLEVQSPSFRMFNGIKVHGSTVNGTTTYTYQGEPFRIPNRSLWWMDVVTTVGPFAQRMGSPGAGMPDDFVARHLQQLRAPRRPADV